MAQTLRVHASNGGTSVRRLQHPNKVPASNTEQPNYPFKFASEAGDFFPDPYTRENGSSSALGSQNQGILDELEDFIQGSEHQTNNNNKRNSLPNKMATSNSSGASQPTANANGFQMSMSSTTGLSNKPGTVSLGTIPSSVHLNNQLPPILDPGSIAANSAVTTRTLSQSNANSANMKLLAVNRPALSPQNQFNQYNTRQEMLFRGYRDVPIAPRAPNVTEQYGSQQRFMSGPSENELRGLNPQSSTHYPHNYYTQDSHNSQSGQRVANSQTDERNMITNQHFQWQNRLQTANHCSPNLPTNSSPGPSMSRTQMQVRIGHSALSRGFIYWYFNAFAISFVGRAFNYPVFQGRLASKIFIMGIFVMADTNSVCRRSNFTKRIRKDSTRAVWCRKRGLSTRTLRHRAG